MSNCSDNYHGEALMSVSAALLLRGDAAFFCLSQVWPHPQTNGKQTVKIQHLHPKSSVSCDGDSTSAPTGPGHWSNQEAPEPPDWFSLVQKKDEIAPMLLHVKLFFPSRGFM